jgi:hypothetical protein
MDMVRLLLQYEATFDAPNWRGPDWVGKDLAEMVYYLKYDSMADILQQELGFEIRNRLSVIPGGHDGSWQQRWVEAGRVKLYKWRDNYD